MTEYKSFVFDLALQDQEATQDVSGDWIIKGYASTWNPDLIKDVFDRKAFDETILMEFEIPKQRTGSPEVRFCRQHEEMIVIGVIQVLKTDEKGLYFEAKVSKTAWGTDTYILCKDKALNKVSVGFIIQDAIEENGFRIILKAKLLEISIVSFSMNNEAELVEVKSMDSLTKLISMVSQMQDKVDMLCSHIMDTQKSDGNPEPQPENEVAEDTIVEETIVDLIEEVISEDASQPTVEEDTEDTQLQEDAIEKALSQLVEMKSLLLEDKKEVNDLESDKLEAIIREIKSFDMIFGGK